jgi:serine/threonine protein phosphatase PrpC
LGELMGGYRLDSGARSDTGCVRAHNEDAYCARPDVGLWSVADGMGGHEHGDWASATTIEALQAVPAAPFDTLIESVSAAIYGANARIFGESQVRGSQMGTTVVALAMIDTRFGIFWAGDSRAYLLRDGQLIQLTVDHTQVQMMLDRGLISEAEAAVHPMRHVLARAIGVDGGLEIDAFVDEAVPGDVFLLCSDGLTGVVEDHEIADAMRGGGAEGIAENLVALSLSRGAPDNVTVCVVGLVTSATQITLGGETAS